jgi:hypothetical protein
MLKEFPIVGRDEIVDHLPFIKKNFLTYKEFAGATVDKLFTAEQIKGAVKYSANWFKTSFIRNNGNGRFTIEELPDIAQLSGVYGIVVEDIDGDGNLDICLNTNDFGVMPSLGRHDALNGLMLKGNGQGGFIPLSIQQSGLFVPGSGRAFCMLAAANNSPLFAASQNRGELKFFSLKAGSSLATVPANAVAAELMLANNRIRKTEFPSGSSFLSQSSAHLLKTEAIKKIIWIDSDGKKWQ